MNEDLNEIITKTLNLKDMGTYYSSNHSVQAINKNDMVKLIELVEASLAHQFIQICKDTKEHFRDMDEISPDQLKSDVDQGLNRVIYKISTRTNLRKVKAT